MSVSERKFARVLKLVAVSFVALFIILACSNTNDPNHLLSSSSYVENKENENIVFTFDVQYIRTRYIYDHEKPYPPSPEIILVSSRNELEQYYEENRARIYDGQGNWLQDENFLNAIEQYSDDYFANNFLAIVKLEEPSGSIRHRVESVDKDGNIVINRLLPIGLTWDMAAWSIIIAINNNFRLDQYHLTLVDVQY